MKRAALTVQCVQYKSGFFFADFLSFFFLHKMKNMYAVEMEFGTNLNTSLVNMFAKFRT
jgi:hypothetical protein